jgi:Domain of unknown function (DUF222)/HNH endonuclease
VSDNVALGDEIAEIAGRINVATHRLLTCVRRFDEAEGWFAQGAQSCAHWLTWRVGMDPGTAREKVRVARALGGLPAIDEAFAAGRVSYAQVRAMTRVATADNEARILEVALEATGAQLERICRGLKRATSPEAEQAADRRVRARALGSGLVSLSVVVSPDEADLLIRAIEKARAAMTPAGQAVAESSSSPVAPDAAAPRPSAADGLLHIAASYLDADTSGVGQGAAPDAQVVIHLDNDLGAPDGGLSASLDDGTHVSAETLRRVACDGGLVAAVVDERGGVLDVGRRTRAIPTAIKRALWLRDQGCRFPGCTNRRFVHGHHVEHWLHGGHTSLDNLLLLCSFHHRLVHEGGFTIALTDSSRVEVRTPSGSLLPAVPSLAPDSGAVEWNGDWWTAGDHFAPPAPPGYGGDIDYHETISSLVT